MTAMRLAFFAATIFSPIVGCGGASEKVTPKVTPEMKAEQDKAHAQVKSKLEAETKTPADPAK